MRTRGDFPIGQPCIYRDLSCPDGVYLRVVYHRPKGDMIIFQSDDKWYEFGRGPNNEFLTIITEEEYKIVQYRPSKKTKK